MVKLNQKLTVKVITAKEKADLTFTRIDILTRAWERSTWLRDLRLKKQLKITPALKERIYIAQVEASNDKILFYGLKDEELEIRVKELEEKLAKGVLIPHESK